MSSRLIYTIKASDMHKITVETFTDLLLKA